MACITSTLLMILMLAIAGLAQNVTTEELPFGGVYSGCTAEPIAVSGTISAATQIVFTGNTGMIQTHIKAGPNMVAVGLNTGLLYSVKVNEFAKFMFDRDQLSDVSLKQAMTLKGPGPDNDIKIISIVRFTFDGIQFNTKFEKSSVICK